MCSSDLLFAVTTDEWNGRMANPGGWAINTNTVSNSITLVPYVAPVVPPSIKDQANVLLANGVEVVSNTDTTLNSVYDISVSTQSHMQAEVISIMLSGGTAFADGSNSVAWPDVAGNVHTFDVPHFQSFALGIGGYVARLYKCINGTATTLPGNSITIA